MTEVVTTRDILWAVYDNHLNHIFRERIKRDLDREVDPAEFADDAMKKIKSINYPLIIVQDVMARRDLSLPPGLKAGNYPGISQYVIGEIRKTEINEKTPIIVVGEEVADYVNFQDYLDAGADECFRTRLGAVRFAQTLEKYL